MFFLGKIYHLKYFSAVATTGDNPITGCGQGHRGLSGRRHFLLSYGLVPVHLPELLRNRECCLLLRRNKIVYKTNLRPVWNVRFQCIEQHNCQWLMCTNWPLCAPERSGAHRFLSILDLRLNFSKCSQERKTVIKTTYKLLVCSFNCSVRKYKYHLTNMRYRNEL